MQIQPLILAAGKGTRMRSARPKVLQLLAGKPLLQHVLESCSRLDNLLDPVVVIGFGADQIRQEIGNRLTYVIQEQQLGTGHAVQSAADYIRDDVPVVVLYGDVPLISPGTINKVAELAGTGALALLTLEMADPTGYGRILRNPNGNIAAIVEDKDATEEQKQITEINTGVLSLNGKLLKHLVAGLSAYNAQGEYYLTDIVEAAIEQGVEVLATQPEDPIEVMGVNDRIQLAELEGLSRQRATRQLMLDGATLVRPDSVEIQGTLEVGTDVVIGPNVIFQGNIKLGDDVVIDANSILIDSEIAAGAHIRPFSHLEGASVGEGAVIGPYARLREGSKIGARARIGNFVETKNIQMGAGSKANHLTYLGDTRLGENVNVGAGTITCNYDGKNKHRTEIGDDAFIGSNSALVAPIIIGRGATVAAGSVVTKDVADNELCIVRPGQRSVSDWKRPDQKQD
ncbi:MAG: bifunctional UDP-N-acetylglucosamine diphosphorylase/glucosamine-1-phosphate N-acetyltransferase GlmU [Pseudomonadales bacterium]